MYRCATRAPRVTRAGTYGPGRVPLRGCTGLHLILYFIEMNFSKLTHNNQIFRNDFVCIHYHLCKISPQTIECKIFAPDDFLDFPYHTIVLYALCRDLWWGLRTANGSAIHIRHSNIICSFRGCRLDWSTDS